MQENFTGCRVLAYCLMSNHVHILLEVPPMVEGGLSDDELLRRMKAVHHEVAVAEVAKRLAAGRKAMAGGRGRVWCGRSWRTRVTRRTRGIGRARCRGHTG